MTSHPHPDALADLEAQLGYHFTDRDLLGEALTHRSYAGEHHTERSYERLEFLGDAVLQLAITEYLFELEPKLVEGEMAKVRAAVVNERTLARLARTLHVGPALELGRGEDLTGGRDKDSLLSDVVEALVGAIYREAGYATAAEVVMRHWRALVDERAEAPGQRDFKTRLQEILAQRGMRPRYEVVEAGPEHAKEFTAEVFAGHDKLGEGVGTSKKRAEQAAAHAATEPGNGAGLSRDQVTGRRRTRTQGGSASSSPTDIGIAPTGTASGSSDPGDA